MGLGVRERSMGVVNGVAHQPAHLQPEVLELFSNCRRPGRTEAYSRPVAPEGCIGTAEAQEAPFRVSPVPTELMATLRWRHSSTEVDGEGWRSTTTHCTTEIVTLTLK